MTPVLDRAYFDHMTGGDRALQLEIVALFRAQADDWDAAFAEAEDWRGPAHTLKGSARGIGLHALALACEVAEAAPGAACAQALADLRAALRQGLAALEQFAAQAP